MRGTGSVVVGVALVAVAVRVGVAQEPSAASPHGELRVALDCGDCHTETGWKPAKRPLEFEHDRQTAFPLTGRHEDAACGMCHLALRFDEPKVVEGDCASCHVDVHQGNLSENCVTCHTTVTFTDVAGLSVHARTSFPLTGAHMQVSCESCHTSDLGGGYTTLDTDCLSCHEQDYTGAASVDHAALQFSTNCTECHSTLGWGGSGGDFDHPTVANGFALVGAHAAIRCESCHVVPGLAPLFPSTGQDDCFTCHEQDYQRSHSGSATPTDCIVCHNVDTWEGAAAEFDHASVANGFELVGAHAPLECASCHIPPGTELIYTPVGQDDCIACHQSDYDTRHAGTGFPPTCLECHTVDTWMEVQFVDHDGLYFPIYSGAHRGRWGTCQTCHEVANDFALFTCFNCHQHDQASMDSSHRGRNGYVYESTACYACHPNGRK